MSNKHSEKGREAGSYGDPMSNLQPDIDSSGGIFLRTNWQVQGYLQEQADTIEKYAFCRPRTSSIFFHKFIHSTCILTAGDIAVLLQRW